MSSRRYPVAEAYEERSRDFYGPSGRTHRSYDELDIDNAYARGPDPRRSQPDFLRDDYGRTSAGPLVLRGNDDLDRGSPRPRTREIEKEEVVITNRRGSAAPAPRERNYERDDISVRRGEERARPRQVEKEHTELVIRHREEEERPRHRPREYERDDIIFRRGEGERAPPRPREREREFEREEVRFRHDERSPRGGETEREEFIYRRDERDSRGPPARAHSVEREEIVIRRDERESRSRPREKSLPPPRGPMIAREREEVIVRRHEHRSPTPPPPMREIEKEEIIIRRTEQRAPTPPPAPDTPPPPPLEPVVRPPIIQEIITHHRHIDHGVERARSPTPPLALAPPSPPREESLEVSIRRSNTNGRFENEEIIFERDTIERRETDLQPHRRRSSSPQPVRRAATARNWDVEAEAEYYNRRATERGFVGEAHHGATKDWAIVDVPPGTQRVKMDGVGGAGQEITWQRYNGVRRAKFMTEEGEFTSDFGIGSRHAHAPAPAPAPPAAPPAQAPAVTSDTRITIRKEESHSNSAPSRVRSDMWTEITKDLVLKDAIEYFGYDYEETEFFYYVMEYLRYEDVLQLVELSDDLRRDRRARIKEIQWEREELDSRRHHHHHHRPGVEERVYEREVIYDNRRGGRYR